MLRFLECFLFCFAFFLLKVSGMSQEACSGLEPQALTPQAEKPRSAGLLVSPLRQQVNLKK